MVNDERPKELQHPWYMVVAIGVGCILGLVATGIIALTKDKKAE